MIEANRPDLQSWVNVPADSDFPIQNLPFGIFSTSDRSPRPGVAIGNQILDLHAVAERGLLDGLGCERTDFAQPTLNAFIDRGKAATRAVRGRVSELLRERSDLAADATEKAEGLNQISNGQGRTTCAYFLPGDTTVVFASTHLADTLCPEVPPRGPKGEYVWPIYEGYDVFTYDLEGNPIAQLTFEPGYDAEATVSPTGDRWRSRPLRPSPGTSTRPPNPRPADLRARTCQSRNPNPLSRVRDRLYWPSCTAFAR